MAPKARLIFEFLPLTPIVILSRMFCYGRIEGAWLYQIGGFLLLTVFSLWLAIVLLRRRLIQ